MALENGFIQSSVASAIQRQQSAARRKDAITGTSDYPNLSETVAVTLDVAKVAPIKETAPAVTVQALPRARLAEPFERLREASDRILAEDGTRPKSSWLTSEKSLISPRAPPMPRTSMRPAASRP